MWGTHTVHWGHNFVYVFGIWCSSPFVSFLFSGHCWQCLQAQWHLCTRNVWSLHRDSHSRGHHPENPLRLATVGQPPVRHHSLHGTWSREQRVRASWGRHVAHQENRVSSSLPSRQCRWAARHWSPGIWLFLSPDSAWHCKRSLLAGMPQWCRYGPGQFEHCRVLPPARQEESQPQGSRVSRNCVYIWHDETSNYVTLLLEYM